MSRPMPPQERNLAFSVTQNTEENIGLLLARRQVQRETNRALVAQIVFILVIPALLGGISSITPEVRPFSALTALINASIDILFVDRYQKRRLIQSAKLQEEFDCAVFDLPWNHFIAGDKVSRKFIANKAARYKSDWGSDSVIDWYPSKLDSIPLALARIAAQRLNLIYDASLRSGYRLLLLLLPLVGLGLLLLLVAYGDVDMTTVLLSVIVPTVPAINWCSREFLRQHDTIVRSAKTKMLVAGIWGKMIPQQPDDNAARQSARDVQNASYIRRANSPVVFEALYWLRRTSLDKHMKSQAEALIREALEVR